MSMDFFTSLTFCQFKRLLINQYSKLKSRFFYKKKKMKWYSLGKKKKLFVLSAKILLLIFVNLIKEMV